MDETMKLLTMLLQAVHAEYPQDKCRPGLVLSYLARDGKFYASIVRYRGEMGEGKHVILARTETTAADALTKLAEDFVGFQDAKPRLREFLAEAQKTRLHKEV
jgi:hypothetical protein